MRHSLAIEAAILAGLCAVAGGALAWASPASAADTRTLTDSRARIEQDIRRSFNNANRYVPADPLAPRIRERHLGTGERPAACAYQYGRWQRTGSPYWRDRYFECAG